MSQDHSVFTQTIQAKADVDACAFVDFDGSIPAAGARAAGPTRTDGKAGDLLPVDTLGTAIAIAGAAITLGQRLELDAAGHVIPLDQGVVVAVAVETAAVGQSLEVSLIPN